MKYLSVACVFVIITSGFKANTEDPKPGKIELIYAPQGGKNQKIVEAVGLVNQLFEGSDRPAFMKAVMNVKDYTYSFEPAENINKWVFETDLKLKIRGYKGGNDTRTLAYVTSDYPDNIFINLSKLDERKSASVAATIVHEIVHSIDRLKTDARFGHSGNSARGKQNSAPYAIGRIARQVITRDITLNKNNSSQQLRALLDQAPEEDMFVIEESEAIDESQVIR